MTTNLATNSYGDVNVSYVEQAKMAKTFFVSHPFGTIKTFSHVEQKLDTIADISLYLLMLKVNFPKA